MAKTIEITVPDIGDFDAVEVIEVLVKAGDQVKAEDSLITLESDKASMDIPSPNSGTIKEIKIEAGQKISQGHVIALIEVDGENADKPVAADADKKSSGNETKQTPKTKADVPVATKTPPLVSANKPATLPVINEGGFSKAHASPAVRKFARELGANLSQISGSGNKGRILKEDVQNFIKQILSGGTISADSGMSVAPPPQIDFASFGEIESQPLSKINKLTGKYLHSSWAHIPQNYFVNNCQRNIKPKASKSLLSRSS